MVELGEAGRACVAGPFSSRFPSSSAQGEELSLSVPCRAEAVKSVVSDKDQLNPNAF